MTPLGLLFMTLALAGAVVLLFHFKLLSLSCKYGALVARRKSGRLFARAAAAGHCLHLIFRRFVSAGASSRVRAPAAPTSCSQRRPPLAADGGAKRAAVAPSPWPN